MKIIYEKDAIDALHKTMLEFFKTDGDDEPEFITASEKMLLSVNKAISNALKALPSAQTDVADENLQFTEQEKEFLCMLFSLCNEMLGMKGRYMEIGYKPFGHNELFELSQKLKIDY